MKRIIREAFAVIVFLPVLIIFYAVGWLFYDSKGEP